MTPLKEVAQIDRVGVSPEDISSGTLYIGLEHIEAGGRILHAASASPGDIASTKFRFDDAHVLYGKLRPYLGKIALPEFTGICSTDILPIRPGPDLDRRYLAHFLRQPTMVDYAASLAAGANLPRLSPNVLGTFPIPLPPLPEQRRIAAILDQADALRAKRRATITALDTLTESIFLDMFEHTSRQVEFGSVIVNGPTNGLYRPSSDYGSGTPILRIDGFDHGAIHDREWKRVRIPQLEIHRFGLAVGDIVVNRVNALSHLGKSALIESLPEPSVYESNMMRIRLDTDRVLPRFAIAWFQTASAKRQVLSKAKKAINQASINQADVRSLVMPFPAVHHQQQFAERVEWVQADRLIALQSFGRLDELFRSLQSHAFRGEL